MKYLFIVLTAFFLNACGDTGHDGKNGVAGDSTVGPKGDTGDVGTSSNGVDGTPGLNSLVTLTNSDNLDSDVCKSGSGVVVSSGLDLNSDGTLTDDEITSEAVLCQTKAAKDKDNNGNGKDK